MPYTNTSATRFYSINPSFFLCYLWYSMVTPIHQHTIH
ncbi:unnamed protein product [Brassica oleracea]